MKKLMIVIALTAYMGLIQTAMGQDYPVRPITMVVPLAAGGSVDITARIIAERMRAALGQPVVVENVPGAAGTIGVSRVARAAPDGYTIIVGDQTSSVISAATYQVQYDVIRDFEPVSLLSTSPVAMVAKGAMHPQNLKELIAWLRANPDKATIATFGQGSGPHIISVAFQNQTATRLVSVPYRGVAAGMQDLVSGQVDLMFVEASSVMPHVRSGAIKAYAILARSRWAAAPEIPAIDEAGGPPLYITTWRGLWVPKGTPENIRNKLLAAVTEVLGDPSVGKRFAELGQEIVPRDQQTPEALGVHHKAEIERWWPMIKAAGIRAD